MRLRPLLLLGPALALAVGACGVRPEAGTPAECLDDDFPLAPPPEGGVDATLQAVLVAEERQTADDPIRAGDLRVAFQDTSTYEGTPAPFVFDSPTCWRITGEPVTTSPATPLSMASVRVEGGLSGGPVESGPVDGYWRSDVFSPLLDGGDLTLLAVSDDAAPTFPGFELTGPSAAPVTGLTLDRPQVGGDLLVQWEPAGGTWIELQLVTRDPARPDDPRARNRIVCRAVDDGCHRIPPGALDWLSIYDVQASLRVERHVTTQAVPGEGALATIDAIQTVLNEVDLRDGHSVKDESP